MTNLDLMLKSGWIKIFRTLPKFAVPLISRSASETSAFGAELGGVLEQNSIICFFGDLGAGKTTFIKGVVGAISAFPQEQVSSPTYTYLNIYPGPTPVYHFDLYRLGDAEDFLQMGFDEFFSAGGICCIEWSERLGPLLPKDALCVVLRNISMEERQIELLPGVFSDEEPFSKC